MMSLSLSCWPLSAQKIALIFWGISSARYSAPFRASVQIVMLGKVQGFHRGMNSSWRLTEYTKSSSFGSVKSFWSA